MYYLTRTYFSGWHSNVLDFLGIDNALLTVNNTNTSDANSVCRISKLSATFDCFKSKTVSVIKIQIGAIRQTQIQCEGFITCVKRGKNNHLS